MSHPSPPRSPAEFFDDDDPRIAYNRVWFNIMRAHRRLLPSIAKALKAEGLADPIWFEILMEVERAGPRGQLMGQLEEILFVPQYALSRHISRLEKEGFLRREHIADGRRKQVLFLTETGTGLHQRIWPTYMAAIQADVAGCMSTDEAYLLSRLMIKLLPGGRDPGRS
jgi:DNA-binding MarR family transcriptional regulator